VEAYLRIKYLTAPSVIGLAAMTVSPEVTQAVIEPSYLPTGYRVMEESVDELGAVAAESTAVMEADPSLQLQVTPSNGKLLVAFPELLPTGDYHLHQSSSLLDIDDPGKRIFSIYREEILLMDPFTRLHTTVEVDPPSSPGFFRLFYQGSSAP
jgi:hypothetical protein